MAKEYLDCVGCNGCDKSGSGCAGCGGCPHSQGGGELLLCREELLLLEELAQFAFLPVIKRHNAEEQCYLPAGEPPSDGALTLDGEIFSKAIASLLWKKLIVLDEGIPLKNVAYGTAAEDPGCACGSIALTLQGQEAIRLVSLGTWET